MKKALKPCIKRELVVEVKEQKSIGKSRACRVLKLSRSSCDYESKKNDDYLIEALLLKAEQQPREGFKKAYNRLRNEGFTDNHKRMHRVYKSIGLPLRNKKKKRLPQRIKQPLEVPMKFTHTWSIDFMSDALVSTRKFRSFNVIDDYNREVLYIENDFSIKSSRVVWVLEHLVHKYGSPERIRMDNGPEFIANKMKEWSKFKQIEFIYIQPGKPTQNSYIERFNRTYREKVLDSYIFKTINEVRSYTEEFIEDYNNYRPHDSLGGLPPIPWKYGQQAKLLKHRQLVDHIPTA